MVFFVLFTSPQQGHGGHFPTAVVSPQHDDRVHGHDLGKASSPALLLCSVCVCVCVCWCADPVLTRPDALVSMCRYDAKKGFVAGGSSLHSCMSAHGPDAPTFNKATNEVLVPTKFDKGLAIMFETKYQLNLSRFATEGSHRDRDYHKCWSNLPKTFKADEK